ncbi:MAG: hypothetical protein ACXU95_14095, partial [Isosphaeraceae bacterium]
MSPNVSTWQPNQRTIRLRDGRGVHVRPIRAEDEPLLQGRIAVEQAEVGRVLDHQRRQAALGS